MKMCVAGTAHTKFGKASEDIGGLIALCSKHLLHDVNLDVADIDAFYISDSSSHFSKQCHLSALLSSKLQLRHESTHVEAACASGGAALKQALPSLQARMTS